MRGRAFAPMALAVAFTAVLAPAVLQAQSVEEARGHHRAGRYDEAVAAYRAVASRPDAPPEAHRGLASALSDLGRHQEAVRHLRGVLDADAEAPVRAALGEALHVLGELDDAEDELRRAAAADGGDRWLARFHLGELLWETGRRGEALELFDSFIDLYNAGGRLSAAELAAVGQAVAYLGVRDPQLFHDALRALDEAIAADPGDPLPHVLVGELFLEKYVSPEAHAAFQEALALNPRHPRALLGEARALDFDGQGGAMEMTNRALEVDPSWAPARAFLARLHLSVENDGEARREAERALEASPASPEALAALAAAHWLTDDTAGFERVRDRALALNPAHGDLFITVAEVAERRRRYAEAVTMAERARRVDTLSSRALGVLGMNQLRMAAIGEGRASLEAAFAADPFNPWYKNTLDLLDTFERYEVVESPHFRLVLRGDEAGLLGPYAAALAEEAWDSLAARYGMEPPAPIRVEMFPNHADFSVRTLGMPGLGALGVAFGPVLVMDSPSAREPGDFNWASTLWHELAHAFHMAASDHRVPRWFSEGLAVHEQRRARAGWGHPMTASFLQAWRAGRLHPVSELNRGFVRPDYPEQVVHSYLQASLVFAMLEEAHGWDAVRTMLEGYRDGRTTEELARTVLGTDMEGLDRAFEAWIEERYGHALAGTAPLSEPLPAGAPVDALRLQAARHPGDFAARLRAGRALVEAGALDEAEEHLKAALRIFPEYGGPDGPWLWLGRLHRERGEPDLAAAALLQHAARVESALDAALDEAEARRSIGDAAGAARALERAVTIHPFDPQVHRRLAEAYAGLGDARGAVRERAAVLALDPVDRADAHYRLALAYVDAGDADAARRQVLRALEVAPGFREAQDLLLRLRGGGP
ncbi:MAG: tetratricopeptide repeat protein [Gemmatimonadetes bacterium]|nr:tetratricopeptide repeat protein [Gemmatimonadota bacterium]